MSSNSPIQLKLRSFESQVLYFNGMYKLPIAAFPSPSAEVTYQTQKHGSGYIDEHYLLIRLRAFKKILADELSEVDGIIEQLITDAEYQKEDFLTDMADWLGDIQVYCASEMARLGIPLKETLNIIMQSNFSKLGEDGQPIIMDGKVQKGPGYWKPEPMLKQMLQNKIAEATSPQTAGPV